MRRSALSLFLAVIATLAVVLPIAASAITLTITMIETDGNSYSNFPFTCTMDNTQFTSTGLDVQVKDGTTPLPAILATDRTNFVGSLAADSTKHIQFTTGNTPASSMPIVVGNGGYFTTPDNPALDVGTVFALTINAPFNGSEGDNSWVLYIQHALKIYVPDAGTITASILDSSDNPVTTVSKSGLSNAVHTLSLSADGDNLSLQIDGWSADTQPIGSGVPDSDFAWVWDNDNVCPWINYITLGIGSITPGILGVNQVYGGASPVISNAKSVINIGTGKFAYYYLDSGGAPYVVAGTLGDHLGAITFGTPVSLGSYISGTYLASLGTDKFAVVKAISASPNRMDGYVGDVSGTTISMSGASTLTTNTYALVPKDCSQASLATDKFALFYYVNSGTKVYDMAVVSASGDTLTMGTPTSFSPANGSQYYYCTTDATNGAFMDLIHVWGFSVSGTSVTMGTTTTLGGTGTVSEFGMTRLPSAGAFIIGWNDLFSSTNHVYNTIGNVADGTLVLGTKTLYNSATGTVTNCLITGNDSVHYAMFYEIYNSPTRHYYYVKAIVSGLTPSYYTQEAMFEDKLINNGGNTTHGLLAISEYATPMCIYRDNLDGGGGNSSYRSVFEDPVTTAGTYNPPVERTKYQPVTLISGTTLPDIDSNQDATITWGSNPAGVTISLSDYAADYLATLNDYSTTSGGQILTGNPPIPSQMYTELNPDLPWMPVMSAIFGVSQTPEALWWFPFVFGVIAIVSLMVYELTTSPDRRTGQGTVDGSLLLQCIVIEVLLVITALVGSATGHGGLIPFWPVFIFPVAGAAFVMSKKHYSWG